MTDHGVSNSTGNFPSIEISEHYASDAAIATQLATAKAILRCGGSFADAAEAASLPVETVMTAWGEGSL